MKTGYLLPILLPLFMENYTIAARHKYQDPRLSYQNINKADGYFRIDSIDGSFVKIEMNSAV